MTQTVTTREFMRNFKGWKTKLSMGSLESLEIPISEQNMMRITVVRKQTPFERFLEMVRKNPFKHLKRPKEDLFDERI